MSERAVLSEVPTQPSGQPIPCLVCGGAYRTSSIPALFVCEACGFVSANLNISEAELERLYGENYFLDGEYGNYLQDEQALKLNFDERIAVLKRIVPGFEKCILFEIGCAYGFFLESVSGRVGRVAGIDISVEAVGRAKARGLKAYSGDYLEFSMYEPADAIVLWDTIEHLKRPDLFLDKARRDLKPGGLVALTTGDIGSLNARLRGAKWRMIHPPTHLHYFSVDTISRLLDRLGFEILHVSHPAHVRKLNYILYILARRWGLGRLYSAIENWPIMERTISLNMRDIMFVIARART